MVLLRPTGAAASDLQALARKLGIEYKNLPPLIIKIGTMAPPGTPYLDFALNNVVRKTKEESGGAIRIQIVGGGDDINYLAKMKKGELLGCACSFLGINEAVPEASVFSLPLLFRNYDEVDHITKKFRKDISAMFSRRGYRLLGLIDGGFLYLFTKDRISSITDLPKIKVANLEGEIEKITLDELKADYIPVSVSDAYTFLRSGLVQGDITPPGWEIATQAFLFAHYYVDIPIFYSLAAIFVDEGQLKTLEKSYPPGFIKEFVNYISSEFARLEKEWRAEIREFEAKCIHAFNTSGRTSVSWSQADVDILHKAARNVKNRLAGKLYSREFLSRLETELTDYRKKKGQ